MPFLEDFLNNIFNPENQSGGKKKTKNTIKKVTRKSQKTENRNELFDCYKTNQKGGEIEFLPECLNKDDPITLNEFKELPKEQQEQLIKLPVGKTGKFHCFEKESFIYYLNNTNKPKNPLTNENLTEEFLSKYKSILILDISRKNLTKIPILPETLKKLDCNNNKIKKLENLPETLEMLECNNNEITKLENLPENLETLECNNNEITKLENLPETLRKLDCQNNKIKKLENLPNNLEKLFCENNGIKKLENLPKNLKTLFCENNEITILENLPETLDTLFCRNNPLEKIRSLPKELNEIKFTGKPKINSNINLEIYKDFMSYEVLKKLKTYDSPKRGGKISSKRFAKKRSAKKSIKKTTKRSAKKVSNKKKTTKRSAKKRSNKK